MKKLLPLTLIAIVGAFNAGSAADYRWNLASEGAFNSTAGNRWQVFDGTNWVTAGSFPGATDNIVTPNSFGNMSISTNPGDTVANFNVNLSTDWAIVNPTSGSVARTFTITGTLSKSGAQTLTFRPNGGSSPGFNLSVGTIDLTGGQLIFGTTTLPVTSLNVSGSTNISGNGRLRVNTTSANNTDLGAVTMNGGELYMHDANLVGGSVGGASASSLSGTGTIAAKLFGTESSTATLTLDGTAGSTTFSGTIQDGVGTGTTLKLAKTGAATQILTGANTYSGGTVVSAGTLLINNGSGSATGTGAVSVTNGTFGGAGGVSGAVTVGDGLGAAGSAVLMVGPDGIIANLNTGALSLSNSDAAFVFDLNSATMTSDNVNVTGAMTLGAGLAFFDGSDLGSTALLAGQQFVLATASSGITGNFFGLSEGAEYVLGLNTYRISYGVDLANSLTLTVVPEPNVGLLLGMSVPAFVLMRIRRKVVRSKM